MPRFIILFSLLAICYISPVFAADAKTHQVKQLSLRDAVLLALRYNPNVRNAELSRIVDKYALEVSRNQYEWRYALTGSANYSQSEQGDSNSNSTNYSIAPSASIKTTMGTDITVSTGINDNGTHFNGSDYDSNSRRQSLDGGIRLTQPLMRGFGREINSYPLIDAYDQEKINKLNLKRTITDTVTTVIKNYLQLALSKNALRVQKLQFKNSLKTLEQYELEIKIGRRAGADKIEQESQIARQRLSLVQSENSIAENKLTLANSIGLPPNYHFEIDEKIVLPDQELPSIAKGKRLILKNDIGYQTSLISYQKLIRTLTVARDNLRWKLDLTANSNLNKDVINTYNTTSPVGRGSSVGLNLTIPIDDKSLKKALLDAKIGLQKADIDMQQKKWLLTTGIANTLRNLSIQKQQITLAIQARDLAQQALNNAQIKLRHGLVSTFQTTTLQTTLIEQEISVINAQMNYLSAIVTLQQTLGTTLSIWGIDIRY